MLWEGEAGRGWPGQAGRGWLPAPARCWVTPMGAAATEAVLTRVRAPALGEWRGAPQNRMGGLWHLPMATLREMRVMGTQHLAIWGPTCDMDGSGQVPGMLHNDPLPPPLLNLQQG